MNNPGLSRPATRRHTAVVLAVQSHAPGAVALRIRMDSRDEMAGDEAWALAYTALTGLPAPGDRVLVNTTALDLRLGTGGYHFVIAIEGPSGVDAVAPFPGHLMKLRYTPHQCAVLAAEETETRGADERDDLDLAPVVACELHSQPPAVAAGFLARLPDARIAYVMTDGAALPLAFSRLVALMRDRGLVHGVVTAGQSFGGDLEAINIYSGLLMARWALQSDLIIIGQGPGNAGTGTRFGFSGLQQADAANAAACLGGRPIICLRASAVDSRERHQAPSHHTLTVLDRAVRCRCAVPIARDAPGGRRRRILAALQQLQLHERHDLLTECRGSPGLDLLQERDVSVTTMGRSVADDREFFLHASAAGAAAATMVEMRAQRAEAGPATRRPF